MQKRKNSTLNIQFILLATLAAIITAGFALLNNLTPAEPHLYSGTVIYPYMRYGVLVGIGAFLVLAGFCLRLITTESTKRFLRLFVVMMGCVSVLVASSGHLLLAPSFRHLDSAMFEGNIYHLARVGHAPQEGDYFEWVVLYECDARGILCENIAEVHSVRYESENERPDYEIHFTETLDMPFVFIEREGYRTVQFPLGAFDIDDGKE